MCRFVVYCTCLARTPCCAVGAAAVARRHEIDAGPGVYVCVGAAVPIPAPVAALAVPLREYSEFSVRYFALQRLLLVCPVLARTIISAIAASEYDRRVRSLWALQSTAPPSTIAMGTISPHSYPQEPLTCRVPCPLSLSLDLWLVPYIYKMQRCGCDCRVSSALSLRKCGQRFAGAGSVA